MTFLQLLDKVVYDAINPDKDKEAPGAGLIALSFLLDTLTGIVLLIATATVVYNTAIYLIPAALIIWASASWFRGSGMQMYEENKQC